jgi:DUF971 family protein
MTHDPARATPVEFRKQGRERLRITWADGHAGDYPARYLRARCPCAQCVDEDTGQRRIGDADVAADVGIDKLQLVGSYALQVQFSDGHGTGLFAFDSLRRLCPCTECAGS